jgi:Protein of unknown function (DUF2934)
MDHSSRIKSHTSAQPSKLNSPRGRTEDEVRFRAYQIYVSRNRQPGHALDDWLQAERELLTRN